MKPINFKTNNLGRFFTPQNNANRKFKLYLYNGKQRTIKKRCEVCKYAEVDEAQDKLYCTNALIAVNEKVKVYVKDDGFCQMYDLSEQLASDMYNDMLK